MIYAVGTIYSGKGRVFGADGGRDGHDDAPPVRRPRSGMHRQRDGERKGFDNGRQKKPAADGRRGRGRALLLRGPGGRARPEPEREAKW